MRIDWDTPVDVLMHGTNIDYVDLDDGELMHWKYIKKEKRPNGKWRYYYDVDQLKDDLGVDEKERMNKANAEYKQAMKDAKNYQDYVTKEHYRLGQTNPHSEYRHYTENEYRYLQGLTSIKDAKVKAAEKAGRKASEATSDFYKTPLGKLNKFEKSVKKGLKVVSKFFSKLFGK